MSEDEHEEIKNNVCRILEWYGFSSDPEYNVNNGRVDCAGFKSNNSESYIGIEIHIKGNLDTDLKKLINSKFSYKVIITPDKELINKMSDSTKEISWFLPPSEYEHGFENYIKSISGASYRNEYWYNSRNKIVIMQENFENNAMVTKFEDLLRSNRLNADLAEKIIYDYASAGGPYFSESKNYENTNEYKFLNSLGIVQGLEIYQLDMEYGDKLQYTYEKTFITDFISTRKMRGEPDAYLANRTLINSVIKKYIDKMSNKIDILLNKYSKYFCEVALLGKKGYFRPYTNDFMPDIDIKFIPPAEYARSIALAANPFLSSRFWEFGKTLVNIGLGIQATNELIRAPYKAIAEEFGFLGSIKNRELAVNKYLSWWILYRGAFKKTDMKNESAIYHVTWDDVLECIDETFSRNLTSHYIEQEELRSLNNFMASKGGYPINGISYITVYNDEEFRSYCYKKMQEALDDIF